MENSGKIERSAGILMHISSLPSPFGIGTFGKTAYEFVDFVAQARHRYWQVLPLGPTTYGDSPYQSYSAFAGNPYFVDLEMLTDDGILDRNIYEALEGILNYKLVKVLLNLSEIKPYQNWIKLSENQKNELAKNITKFSINILGTNSFDKAQVCTGGIPLDEIDTKTMQSKKENGLYITGEMIDVDGDCGGYNLEWAWTTGMIAGNSIS